MAAKRVAVSGYFDPIHVGHLDYFELAKELGDELVVIVNNNHQCTLKKGKPFMKAAERLRLVRALDCVDAAVLAVDLSTTAPGWVDGADSGWTAGTTFATATSGVPP